MISIKQMETEIRVEAKLSSHAWSYDRIKEHGIFFSGYLFYKGVPVHTANDLFLLAEEHTNSTESIIFWFKNELLPQANGNFSLVSITSRRLFAATDLVRSRPVYVTAGSDYYIISDRINSSRQEEPPDAGSMKQFLAAGFTFGQTTVFNNITSLRPGEWIDISEGGVKRDRYFQFVYDHSIKNGKSNDELAKELDNVLLRVFKRMTGSVPHNTQWVVPLSGGHDSRLVANYLYRLGIKNVLCYSYGSPGNEQSRISQKVADSLGYRWTFIESTEEEWYKLHNTGLFDRFIHFSFNGDSLPHLQDFLAVHKLKQSGNLDETALFVPGHGIDFISDFVSADHNEFRNKYDLAATIRARYCNLWGNKEKIGSLRTSIIDSLPVHSVPYSSLMEYFAWENRQAKFTANSMQVYEFFGYRWRIPFWEKEIVDFWLRLDCKRRTDQWFYQYANATELLTKPLQEIPYANYGAGYRSMQESRSIKSFLIRMLPVSLLSRIVRFINFKTIDDEGSTLIYSGKAKDVKQLITPLDKWPDSLLRLVKPKFKRYTYQVYFHSLTALYTLHREVFQKKE